MSMSALKEKDAANDFAMAIVMTDTGTLIVIKTATTTFAIVSAAEVTERPVLH
ncbi:MAG: hypothetical protein HY308_18070 [Gammaproteobacteria bacterium]|nr:hypothetical protein [Gammaproteobacteria bacterium]